MQDKYGQGDNGTKEYLYDDGGNIVSMTGQNSFGPLLDGSYFYLGNSIFGRHAPPAIRGNRRLRGTQQYLRMRRALQDSSHYHIQDPIPSWESQHRKP